jgi:type I restriction enzyme M protein
VLDALEEDKARIDPLNHVAARTLLPEYLDGLATLEAEAAELDSTIKAATSSDDEEDESEPDEEALSSAELKQLKAKLAAVRRKLKADKANFARHLSEASDAISGAAARQIVLKAFQLELLAEAIARVVRHRRLVIAAFETWWDKYQTPLSTLEAEREAASAKLAQFLKELGYEG